MSNTTNKQPIEVGILEISSQNRAILEFFFSDAGKSYFKEVSFDKASAYIIDYDSLGAKESWETTFEDTKKPGIIISIKEVDLPSTIWLQKPLTVKALKEAGESIREMMLNKATSEPKVEVIFEEEITKSIIAPEVRKVEKNKKVENPVTQIETDTIELSPLITPQAQVQDNTVAESNLVDELKEAKEEPVPQEDLLEFDDDFISLVDKTPGVTEDIPLKMVENEEHIAKDTPAITNEKPELATADTKKSASSTNFAATSNFIDLDLSLNDVDDSFDKESSQKSSTTPIENPKTLITDEDSEVDSLLESLISGGESTKNDESTLNNNTLTDDNDLLELESTKVEKLETEDINDVSEPMLDPDIILDDTKDVTQVLQDENNTEEQTKTAEDELQSLLDEIRQEAEGDSDEGGNSKIIKKYAPTNAEARWKLICGEQNNADLRKNCFTPSNHLLAALIQNIHNAKQSKQVSRMKFNGIIIVIDPEEDLIYCDQSILTEFYANVCFEPIKPEKIKVHLLDKSEIRLYRKKMNEDSERTHYIESFIWTTSLLTSRGRLPKNTNIKNKVGLSSWPNLTRVEKIPNMMQIAALFHKNTWSLLGLVEKSGIQKNYVIAFYNAALALGVIQTDGEVIKSAPLDVKTGDKKNKSFLSRFIKKLTV